MLRVCTRLLQSGGMPTGSHVGGGRVASIGKYAGSAKKVIKPSITDNKINEDAIQIKMSTLLAKEINYSTEIEPPLPRKWMRAPLSSLSTATTRRDWFRFMSFNMMTDRWGKTHPTTPVCGAKVRVPSFTRQDPTSIDADAFVDYDETLGDELPHFLEPSFRREHLVRLLRSYDPDVVCLNEVNRTFFNDEMWKYVRFLGYGNMYQSSRGSGVKALRKGDDPAAPRNAGKIAEEEDIGNVILFHKGRFVPILIHGVDLGRSFHFAHFTSLRDKVTNLNLVIACVQFTAGDTSAAVETRLHEAKQTLRILEGMQKNDADRSHMSAVICGDLNNQSDDEPCVEVLRERFFSTYDVVGGPRWTCWYYKDDQSSKGYDKYFRNNHESMKSTDPSYMAEKKMASLLKSKEEKYHGKSSNVQLLKKKVDGTEQPWSDVAADAAQGKSGSEGETEDKLALVKENMKAKGAVYQTQDFIFYQPYSLGLHQVLDVPEDSQVNQEELFPNAKLPSHHIPLVIDVSFNDQHPDVLKDSLKP